MDYKVKQNNSTRQTHYLSQIDAAQPMLRLPLIRRLIKSEPLALFEQLREQRPILITPQCVLVSRFDDVIDILKMPNIFTNKLYQYSESKEEQDEEHWISHEDNALHSREKSIMKAMFNRNDLSNIRRLISHSSAKILNTAPGSIDIVNNYCRMVPASLVQDYFGIDSIEKKELINGSFWYQYNLFHNQPFDLNSSSKSDFIHQRHIDTMKILEKGINRILCKKQSIIEQENSKNIFYLIYKILHKRVQKIKGSEQSLPKDDIFTRLLRCNFPPELEFSSHRIAINMSGLLVGSIETTSQAVAQVIHFFISQPGLLVKAKIAASARTTTQLDNMVWEALRFVPINPYLFRHTKKEYTLAKGTDRETCIPEKTNILLLTQSAMFDEECYANAYEFNPDRNWTHHLNYGFGEHDCLGKHIAMEMIPEMVRQVIRLPSITGIGGINYAEGPFPESYKLTWAVK